MASYHFCMHDPVSRGKGQSLVRTAAYNARARLVDERTGEVWDYGRKGGLLAEAVYTPKDAPEWSRDLQRLVNEIERAEKRGDAQLAMNFDIALPHELTLEQNRRLIGDFVREEFSRHGYAAHFAIHAPDREGDERNIHAHVLVSMRKLGPDGFARTKAEQQDNYRNRGEHVEKLRERWERLGNRHLERAGHAPTLDRRSLRERGVDREPEQHRGPKITGMERDGKPTRIGAEICQRQALDTERRQLGAEEQQVGAQIIDLEAARVERQAREAAQDRVDAIHPAPAAEPPRQAPGIERAQPEAFASARGRRDEIRPGKAPQEAAQARDAAAAPKDRAKAAAPSTARARGAEVRKAGDVAERGLSGIFGGLAKGAASIIEGIAESLFPTAPPTPEQAERNERAAEEREAEAADHAAAAAKAQALDDLIDRQQRDEGDRRAAPEYFRHITRGEDQDRARDDDRGRERERER